MATQTLEKPDREISFLRLPEVKKRTALSRSQIYLLESKGQFPKRISLGIRAVGWISSEVQSWIEARIEQSRNKEGGNYEHD